MNPERKLRILIADDDALVGDVVQDLVESTGAEVVARAPDGRQAIDLTLRHRPDLVLMDIEMPEVDGLAAARQIQLSCPTPVILLTAHDDQELVRQAGDLGIGAYLVKPPNRRELERAITISIARFDDLMSLRQLNTQLQKALSEIKALNNILHICSHCRKIRDEHGRWVSLEAYITQHTHTMFSPVACPECARAKSDTLFLEPQHVDRMPTKHVGPPPAAG